jgi:2-iminobutanoate/2-iminopropanoate deaminase
MPSFEELEVDWPWDDEFPLAQAIRVGDLIFLSGQIAVDRNGNIVGSNDLKAQARQCFENMKSVLACAGAKLTNVVRLTTYFTVDLTDIQATKSYWEVRKEYFGDHRLTSTGVQVKSLIYPSLLLEVDAIAVLPKK